MNEPQAQTQPRSTTLTDSVAKEGQEAATSAATSTATAAACCFSLCAGQGYRHSVRHNGGAGRLWIAGSVAGRSQPAAGGIAGAAGGVAGNGSDLWYRHPL